MERVRSRRHSHSSQHFQTNFIFFKELFAERGNNFGVYIDNILKPTIIYDKDSLGQKFILKKVNKSKEEYYWINKGNAPESFPPIYSYLVKDKKLILKKIDTVWKRWD